APACASPPSRGVVVGPHHALVSTRLYLRPRGSPEYSPTSRVFGVDSDCTLRLWQGQQRES
ncbi:MAG: hypothetical protein OK452_05490, partial [Thaumarchaeota archaeon]|nr:hypothetical protein [Nitrososphaerota archaeon]